MEYGEELVHNAPAIAQNAIVSIAKKFKDNALYVMTAPVIAPQPTMLQNSVANPPCALLKAPNSLVIKQVHMPSGKFKAAKPWTELAEAWA